MNQEQSYKIFVYIYVVFTESLGSHWMLSVMPQIVTKNFKITDETKKTGVASQYFISFFFGLIAGSLLWPSIVRYISKKNCILISLLGQVITNILVGSTESFLILSVWRFFFGFFHTINTIGKDFLYEFVNSNLRQIVFTLRSVAVLVSSLFGPLIGYQIYYGCNQNFQYTLACISLIIFSGACLFFFLFYLISPNSQPEEHHEGEEKNLIINENSFSSGEDMPSDRQMSLYAMIKFIYNHQDLRRIVCGFLIIFSVYSSSLVVTIFYIETSWENSGLGISDKEVSVLTILVFLPILILFLISNKLIPKYMTIFTFFRVVIIFNIFLLTLLPALKDLLVNLETGKRTYLIYLGISLFFIFNLNLMSPFANYYMNSRIPKNGRTTFNSITFISVACLVIFMFGTIVPLFSISMFDPRFTAFEPYNQYVCFVIFDVFLILGAWFWREPKSERNSV